MSSIVKTLNDAEIRDAQNRAKAIDFKSPPKGPLNGFMFLAAFDGTMNDRDNLEKSHNPLSSNVGALENAWRLAARDDTRYGSYYGVGPGVENPSDALSPSDYALRSASLAYRKANDEAVQWLKLNPGQPVTFFVSSFSRGDITAAMFSQLAFERGIVDQSNGHVLIPPGRIRILDFGYDAVNTNNADAVAYAPGTQLISVRAENEYRYQFKGYQHNETGAISFDFPGNHGNIGGGYDNGLSAILYERNVEIFSKYSGLDIQVQEGRKFNSNAPVYIYSEGATASNPFGWPEYSSIEKGGVRQYTNTESHDDIVQLPDGSYRQNFTDFNGQKYAVNFLNQLDGTSLMSLRVWDKYGKQTGHIESKAEMDGTIMSAALDMDGDGRFDQSDHFNRWGQKSSAEWEGYDISSPAHYRQSTIVENGKIMSVVIDGANNVTIHVSNQQFSIKNSKGIHVEGTGNTIAVDDTVQGVITGDGNAIHGGNHSDVEIHGKETELHLGEGSRARVFGDNPNIYADGQDVVVDTFGSGVHYRSAVSGNVIGLKGTNNDVVGANTTVWFNGDASCNVHGNGNAFIILGTGNFSNAFGDYNYARANGGGNLIAFTGQSQAIDSVGNRVWLNGDSSGYVVGDQNDLIAGGSNVHFNSLGSYLNATSDGLNNSFSFTGQGIKVNAADDTIWFHEKTRGVIYGDGNTVNAAGDNVVLDAYGDWVKVNSSGQNNSVGVSGKNESVSAQGDGVWFNNGATGTVAGDFNTAVASGDKSQVFINGSYATARSTGEQNVFTFQGVHEQAYADADQVWFNQGSNGGVHGDHNLVVANGAKVNVNVIGNIANVVSNAAGNEFHFQGDGSDFTGNDARLMFTAGSDAHINGLNNTVIGLDFTNFLVPATPGVLGMDATVAPILPIQAPYVPFTMPVVVDPMQFSSQVLAGGSSLPMLGNTLNHVEPISMEPPSASFGFIPVSDVELPQIDFLGAYPIWDGESRPALAPLI